MKKIFLLSLITLSLVLTSCSSTSRISKKKEKQITKDTEPVFEKTNVTIPELKNIETKKTILKTDSIKRPKGKKQNILTKQDSIFNVEQLAKKNKACNSLNAMKQRNSLKLSKMIITELNSVDKKKTVKTYSLNYGKNSYIKNIGINIIQTYGIEGQGIIKMFNKEEINYNYNKKDELIQEYHYKYIGGHKKRTTMSYYSYNNVGFIQSSSIKSGGVNRPRTYEYNENCILTKVNRRMPKIDLDIELNYIYTKGKLTELDINSGDKKSNYSTFIFDNKKNPLLLMYPKNYTLAFPEKYSINNPIETTEKGKKYKYKDIYKYTYNKKEYPKKQVNKYYEKDQLKVTRTTEYFYAKHMK